MGQGLIQVYTGHGKGKTTAATGLILRALGHGWPVLLVRFLKPIDPVSGEIRLLRDLPGITLIEAGVGVIDGKADRAEVATSVKQAFAEACHRLSEGNFRLVVFDELNNALHHEYLGWESVASFLRERPLALEVVFTGRHAPTQLLDAADLVTSMEKIRHPYDQGIPAREGIEF